MNKRILVAGLLLMAGRLYAQNNCDELKKENEYLRKALQITTPVKTTTSSRIDFNLVSCEGNIKEQSVELVLTLVNHAANRTFQFSAANAIDMEANEFETYDIKIGSGDSRNSIYTDVPVKTIIRFKKVLPSTKMLKLVAIEYFDEVTPGKKIGIEYRDIPVAWK
jgi:hypothetical protein